MRRGRILWLALWLLGWAAFGLGPVRAQEGDQPVLRMMETASGILDDEATELRWQFEGQAGDVVSVLAQRVSGDLDPIVEVIDTRGRRLVEGDDIAYPNRLDAALEGIQLPRDGTYTVRVARYEGEPTAGEFALNLLPAYANPVLRDGFSGEPAWQAQSDQAEIDLRDGYLNLTVTASNATPWAGRVTPVSLPGQVYLQVAADVTNTPDYWEYGLVLLATDEDTYQFSVSSRGDWAFQHRQGDAWQTVQDWTEDPAVADIDGPAMLGVQVDGGDFMFYLNGVKLGEAAVDLPGTLAGFGLSAGSIDEQETLPEVRFSDLLITAPLAAAEEIAETDAPLEAWQARDSAAVVAELAAQGLIPEGGQQVMLVPESFTSTGLPGMQALPLGQGRTQTDFVMSASLTIESDSAENACGLLFRQEGADHYGLFFADGLGGLGLAEWQTDRFEPAFYTDQIPAPAGETTGPDRVILVAQGDTVRVYWNGALAMIRPYPATAGGVGIAALSYDGVFVNCRFGDTWLWTWE